MGAGFQAIPVAEAESLEQALRGRVQLIVKSIAGKDISALSNKPEQQEVLFSTGSRFVVTDRLEQTNKVVRIWLRQRPNSAKGSPVKSSD